MCTDGGIQATLPPVEPNQPAAAWAPPSLPTGLVKGHALMKGHCRIQRRRRPLPLPTGLVKGHGLMKDHRGIQQ